MMKARRAHAPIKLPARVHVPLVRCRVRLLGRAAPFDTPDGLQAVQKPLNELYSDYSPVESVIVVLTSGIQLRSPANSGNEQWFPMQDIQDVGAMRPTEGGFVPLSSAEAKTSSSKSYPALFVFVVKRRDVPVSDCWAVECQSDDAASALQTASQLARENSAGWATSISDRPPPLSSIRKGVESQTKSNEEWDGAVAKDAMMWNSNIPQGHFQKPPLEGFYYTPKPGLVQNYAFGEMHDEMEEIEHDMASMVTPPQPEYWPQEIEHDMASMVTPPQPEYWLQEPDAHHGIHGPDGGYYIYHDFDSDSGSDKKKKKKKNKDAKKKTKNGETDHQGPRSYAIGYTDQAGYNYQYDYSKSGSSSSSDSDSDESRKKSKDKKKKKKEKKRENGKKKEKNEKLKYHPSNPYIEPVRADLYGIPPGAIGGPIPESLLFPFDSHSSDSLKKDKKKGKKSKNKNAEYEYRYTPGIMPENVDIVGRHHQLAGSISEPFERFLPVPVDERYHYPVNEKYDPAWHYGLKSYIRDQQFVNGYTEPPHGRPYESHIVNGAGAYPPADYPRDPFADDDEPYERRLPVGGAPSSIMDKSLSTDPRMINRNFILRSSDNYQRHL